MPLLFALLITTALPAATIIIICARALRASISSSARCQIPFISIPAILNIASRAANTFAGPDSSRHQPGSCHRSAPIAPFRQAFCRVNISDIQPAAGSLPLPQFHFTGRLRITLFRFYCFCSIQFRFTPAHSATRSFSFQHRAAFIAHRLLFRVTFVCPAPPPPQAFAAAGNFQFAGSSIAALHRPPAHITSYRITALHFNFAAAPGPVARS